MASNRIIGDLLDNLEQRVDASIQSAINAVENAGMSLEVEAGRALMGNALYRDLIQALVMVQVDVLVLAVPNSYKYKSSGRPTISHDYEKAVSIAETLFSHSRFQFPYKLVLIGY